MTKTVQIIGNALGFEVRADYEVKGEFANYYEARKFAETIANNRKIVEKNIF